MTLARTIDHRGFTMLRVVISTQDELLNARVSKVLSSHSDVEVVGTTPDGLAALDLVWDRQPNVVIVGVLGSPLGSGLLLRLVRDALPGALLVVLADSDLDPTCLPEAAAAYLVHDSYGTLKLVSPDGAHRLPLTAGDWR